MIQESLIVPHTPLCCAVCMREGGSLSLPPRHLKRFRSNWSGFDQLPQGDSGRSHARWGPHFCRVPAVGCAAGKPLPLPELA